MDSSGKQDRTRDTIRVTLIGSVLDLALGIVKIIVGIVGQSQALVADGIHSLSDLGTDIVVIYAARHAGREADEDHPYGHARIETAATVALGVALVVVAAGIGFDAGTRLFTPERLLHPGWLALAVAGISVVSKEAIYQYTMIFARRHRSDMLRANAWHSRSDAISSIIVVIGVIGSMAGLNYLDAIAAIGVALMIIKIGWDLIWHSLRELVDTGLEHERVENIRESILSVDGVIALHNLRTRRMGSDALADVHIQVNPSISVSEGHQISEAVRKKLIEEIEELSDVTVHIDTEDEQAAIRTVELPLRSEIIRRAMLRFNGIDEANEIEQITVHYCDGKVQLELLLPLDHARDPEAAARLGQQFREAAAGDPMISRVDIRYA
ncbi:MAG: cation diffusion facilitator family transporter [Acidiferrobacteraceae bacterium]|jgi:cation diffusion facilitator family transporter